MLMDAIADNHVDGSQNMMKHLLNLVMEGSYVKRLPKDGKY
jgi:hypothetical protein